MRRRPFADAQVGAGNCRKPPPMTHQEIEQMKRERAVAINALRDIADMTIDYKVKQLADQIIQELIQ